MLNKSFCGHSYLLLANVTLSHPCTPLPKSLQNSNHKSLWYQVRNVGRVWVQKGRDGENDVVDQYLFKSPCCYAEQVQHLRQQYVGFAIAWGVTGCMFKSNVNAQVQQPRYACTHMFTQMWHPQLHSRTPIAEVVYNCMKLYWTQTVQLV